MASQRPWIEINGVKSTTIAGLLITSVPPVAKPPKRYQLQAVDGLNGDIRTNLGYAAYDKTVGIGLAGTYDEDAVIAFFDQTGTVIFSNESDKVYTFDAIEGFSMDRLARLRQGEIILHVQPFKADADEMPETATIESVTFNQLIENGNFSEGTTGWTKSSGIASMTADDGVLSFAYTAGSSNINRAIASGAFSSIPIGNVVMIGFTLRRTGDPFNVNVAVSSTITMAATNRTVVSADDITETFQRYGLIKTVDTEAVTRLVFGTRSATTGVDASFELKDVVLYDLTSMFGAAKAAEIAAMETAEAGAGVAYVKKYFPADYYEPNAGEAMSSAVISVNNKGNRPSEPTLTITGSGTVNVNMGGAQYFTVTFPAAKTITIDTHEQEAYWPEGTLANRAVVGEYSRFRIPPGVTSVSCSGAVTAASIEGVSLWT